MKIPNITIHGRFQPPLHINHHDYVMDAFDRADRVTILITNPHLDECNATEADHRNKKENNPFTYDERVEIFKKYFDKIGIDKNRYDFKPFVITNEKDWDDILDKKVPNLVNVYGDWSETKWRKLTERGFQVIRTDNPKRVPVSGNLIRSIINEDCHEDDKKAKLITAGYVPEAIDGLFDILKSSNVVPNGQRII